MACPYNITSTNSDEVTYTSHLKLDTLLSLNQPLSDAHDEYCFVTNHQVYELWFGQIMRELDSFREILPVLHVEKEKQLLAISRLERIKKIWKLLVEQFEIMETITPMDFASFRGNLKTSSGFQSYQFRIIENKFGVRGENRIKHNKASYSSVFKDDQLQLVKQSEQELSCFDLIETWLENLCSLISNTFNFWQIFTENCRKWLSEERKSAEKVQNPDKKDALLDQCCQNETHFDGILEESKYKILRSKGNRYLSWKALQGALMIYYYRDEIILHEAYQMISLLMDIDGLMIKWRCSHILLVHRQLGSKTGTYGTSGYQYLRATFSDRYKVFLDFFNLSSYLIPIEYIPKIDKETRRNTLEAYMSN